MRTKFQNIFCSCIFELWIFCLSYSTKLLILFMSYCQLSSRSKLWLAAISWVLWTSLTVWLSLCLNFSNMCASTRIYNNAVCKIKSCSFVRTHEANDQPGRERTKSDLCCLLSGYWGAACSSVPVSLFSRACCGLFITLPGGEKSRRNLRPQLVLRAVFELHNVGEIQLSPIISGSHLIHHFY